MSVIFQAISKALEKVRWANRKDKDNMEVTGFPGSIPSDWPMNTQLRIIFTEAANDDQGRPIADHVKGVIASINDLVDPLPTTPLAQYLVQTGNSALDGAAASLMKEAFERCWEPGADPALLLSDDEGFFAKGVLRIAALYHDIGKVISTDRHVSRGVHLMRDVNEEDRHEVESLFQDFDDRRNFWSLLRHHDVYGCLCTGEASLPAICDMASFPSPEQASPEINRSLIAFLTYASWLNMADSNARLRQELGGLTTVEAYRYLKDWRDLDRHLTGNRARQQSVTRREFKAWAFDLAGRPERTIRRVTRLVASCFRREMRAVAPEMEIRALVEEELQALHGPRLEQFCYRFARFCKLDYGLRFFYFLMRNSLHREELVVPGDRSGEAYSLVLAATPPESYDAKKASRALKVMVHHTCLVLHRIVEEYGNLVETNPGGNARLGVDMSGLMRPEKTGWAICQSLNESDSRALWWIVDEISVWQYGN